MFGLFGSDRGRKAAGKKLLSALHGTAKRTMTTTRKKKKTTGGAARKAVRTPARRPAAARR